MEIEIVLFSAVKKGAIPVKQIFTREAGFTISENDFTYFQIIANDRLPKDCFLWLSDYRFDFVFKSTSEGKFYYSISLNGFFAYSDIEKFTEIFSVENKDERFYKLFLNNYGICEIEIEFLSEGIQSLKKIGELEIQSNKIEEVDYLLEYLLEKDVFYWSSVSLTKNKANDNHKTKENILWVLNALKQVSNVLSNNFIPNVIGDKIYRLSPRYELTSWNDNVLITDESFIWLLGNIDKLESASYIDEHNFLILNRYYKTSEIQSEILVQDTDVYENQFIHAFLKEVVKYLNNCLILIQTELKKYQNESNFTSRIYSNYFKRLTFEVKEIQQQFNTNKLLLDKYLPVKREDFKIQSSHRFNSKNHYFVLYQNMIEWLERKEAYFSPEHLFTGTSDISKLYESFCLYTIKDCFQNDLGYNLMDSIDTPINPYKSDSSFLNISNNPIKSLYSFVWGDRRINLYYELLPPTLTTTIKNSGKGFRPDFIIEIEDPGKPARYLILDAKYKRIEIIENHDYQQLTLKYLHGIGPKIGGQFNVIGLIIINPIMGSNIDSYQQNLYSINGHMPSLPIIGRVELNVFDRDTIHLSNLLKKLFELI